MGTCQTALNRTLLRGPVRGAALQRLHQLQQPRQASRRAPAKRLEAYRLPRRLVATSQNVDITTRRIKPIFRDAVEFSAGYDLTTSVREALEKSDYLVVLCSPNSAQSVWVGREIELFRALHGRTHILGALIDGTQKNAFHPVLRGQQAAAKLTPLAARGGFPARRRKSEARSC